MNYIPKNLAYLPFIFILTLICCKRPADLQQPDDLQAKQTLLSRVETSSASQLAEWPYYSFGSLIHRQYYTDFEYDDQARLTGIREYKDVFGLSEDLPDVLLSSYVVDYNQDGKLSSIVKYTKSDDITHHQDAMFAWTSNKLVYSYYLPSNPSTTPYLVDQYTFDLNEQGLPIRQSKSNGKVWYTLSYDQQGNISKVEGSDLGVEVEDTKFDLNRLNPYSSSFTIRLWKSLFERGQLNNFQSKNWWLQKTILNNQVRVNAEKIVTTNDQGYPTVTETMLADEFVTGRYNYLPKESFLQTTKYSYIKK